MTIKKIIKKRTPTVWCLITTALLLTGCTDRFQYDAATEVAIIPMTVQADGLNQAQLNAFLDHNRTLLLTEPVTLMWTGAGAKGAAAKNVAVLFSEQLRTLGADPQNVDVLERPGGVPGVAIRYVTYKVQVPDCQPYAAVNEIFSHPRNNRMINSGSKLPQQSCFVESNRWMSLVHPERAYRGSASVSRQP